MIYVNIASSTECIPWQMNGGKNMKVSHWKVEEYKIFIGQEDNNVKNNGKLDSKATHRYS